MSSLKRDLGLQTTYQILSACMPLITAPYLTRRLGASQLGVFSFTSSIVAYFTLAAMLGTINYGTRCIASVKDNRGERNRVFTSIYTLQIVVTLFSLIAYCIYLLFFCRDNRLIAILQGIALLSCLVDINWLFWGVEDFTITVTRSIIIKFLTVGLILLLVREENDLWIYTLIMLGGTFLSNIVLFYYFPKYASFTLITLKQIKEHIIPNLILFVPLLAMSVYHTMDKTMLGALSSYKQSGFYYNSDKIVQIPLLIINGIGTVMLPRMAALLSEEKQKEANDLFLNTLEGVAVISIAIACGIIAIASDFIPFFFGPGFDECIGITIIFAPVLLFKGLSVITRTQYLIPMKMENKFTKSVVGGALVNLILNLLLIVPYGARGAAIATVIAEIVACLLQFLSLRDKKLGLRKLPRVVFVYLLMGFLMIGMVRGTALLQINIVLKLLVEIVVGMLFYSSVCLIYWKKSSSRFYTIFCNSFLQRIRQ